MEKNMGDFGGQRKVTIWRACIRSLSVERVLVVEIWDGKWKGGDGGAM